jgi:hypothetical protein
MTRLAALFFCCSAILLRSQPPPRMPSVHDVIGTVLDIDTHEPIARATITFSWRSPETTRELALLTDSAGSFHIANVSVGFSWVSCHRVGYVGSSNMQIVLPGAPATLYLRKQALIDGIATRSNGKGAIASIAVFRMDPVDGRWQPVLVTSTQTNRDGVFRVAGLQPGHYYVAAYPTVYPERADFAAILYPHAATLQEAQMLDLHPGSEEHLEFHLDAQPVYDVQVRIDINPEGLSCNLLPFLEPIRLAATHVCAWNEKTHTFLSSRVPAGTYLLEARWREEGRDLSATKKVTIGGNLQNVVLDTSPARQLRGRVMQDVWTKSQSIVRLTLQRATSSFSEMQPDGSFLFPDLLTGRFRVDVDRDNTQCLASIRQGTRDVLRDGVQLGDEIPEPLEVTLTNRCGRIDGLVAIADTFPRMPFTVAFFRRVDDMLIFDSQVSTGMPTRFASPALSPGDYLVFAWPTSAHNITQLPYATPEFLREFGSLGESVTVPAGDKMSVTVRQALPAGAFANN